MSITLGPIFNVQAKKIREWSITINLFDARNGPVAISDPVDAISVKDGYHASFDTLSGYSGMKMTQSAATEVRTGKNLGKKNETNVLTQAYKEALSKYNSKIKAGYSAVASATSPATDVGAETVNANRAIAPHPMAVKSWKDHKDKLTYPLFIQPKLDGCRMVAFYHDGEVKLVTRRLHDVPGFERIKQDLKIMFEASGLKSYFIDGELYKHGMSLQEISGIVRNVSMEEAAKEQLQFYVFDCFDVTQPNIGFTERIQVLGEFVNSAKTTLIVLNETERVETDADAELYYKKKIADGYEGAIYKSTNKPYGFDYDKEKRSAWYLKRKKQEDAEFRIVGFTQGKGKDVGCIVFELETDEGKRFKSVPNGSYEYRKELYGKAVELFDIEFAGKLAKVVYDDVSKAGVPLRGRIVQIGRDISFD